MPRLQKSFSKETLSWHADKHLDFLTQFRHHLYSPALLKNKELIVFRLHTRTNTRTDARTNAHACTDTGTHGRRHAWTQARMDTRMDARTHARTHARTLARTLARTHVHTGTPADKNQANTHAGTHWIQSEHAHEGIQSVLYLSTRQSSVSLTAWQLNTGKAAPKWHVKLMIKCEKKIKIGIRHANIEKLTGIRKQVNTRGTNLLVNLSQLIQIILQKSNLLFLYLTPALFLRFSVRVSLKQNKKLSGSWSVAWYTISIVTWGSWSFHKSGY